MNSAEKTLSPKSTIFDIAQSRNSVKKNKAKDVKAFNYNSMLAEIRAGVLAHIRLFHHKTTSAQKLNDLTDHQSLSVDKEKQFSTIWSAVTG